MKFIQISIIWILSVLFSSDSSDPPAVISDVALGWSKTSVNTAIFRQNSLVTHGEEQYIAFYDSAGNVVLGKRMLGSEAWTLHSAQYTGNVLDAHNVISIMVDGDGYLHVAWDHHGHPLNYCRSVAPGAL